MTQKPAMTPLALFAVVAGAALAALGLYAGAVALRLNGIEARVASGPRAAPRADLAPEVLALAERVGVVGRAAPAYAAFEQAGEMWASPAAAPMRFTARQLASATAPAFIWRAAAGPAGLVEAVDYAAGGAGGLEVRLLGAIPIARSQAGPQTLRGELMRYLAELPWNPDAILYDRALDWTVIDARTLRVAAGEGAARAEVVLALDADGLVAGAEAAARPRVEGGKLVERPWRGRFGDYRRIDGRLIPMAGEVAWIVDGRPFVYWRGRLTRWTAAPWR